MNKKPRAQPPNKTWRFRLGHRSQADVWFGETQALFNCVAAFYFDVLEAHAGVLDFSDPEALTRLEQLTHQTKENPDPVMPLVQVVPGDIPAMFRRAAIHAALGAARSFHFNLGRWRKEKARVEAKARAKGKPSKFHARPPVPPRAWNKSTVLYAGMWKKFDGRAVLLRVWTGTSWAWVKFQVSGRAIPEGWKTSSPRIVHRSGRWQLHIPIVRTQFKFPSKVESALAEPPQCPDAQRRVCAVDLNISDSLAVCTILKADGTAVATQFIRGGRELQSRRKRALGRVAVKRSQTGMISKYETDNVKLFRYIRAIDDDTAHRVSRRIVAFAREYGASIIVFEHLGHFKPEKGKYSKRGNEKRTYWLRGKIVRFTQYKAWEQQIITCRVSPRDTSRLCAGCGEPLARYNAGEAPVEYQPGAPLFVCGFCLRRGNADRNASVNVGHKLLIRHECTHFQKPSPTGEGVVAHQGTSGQRFDAKRTREQGKPLQSAAEGEPRPSSNGADDRVGTACGIPRSLRSQRSGGYAASTSSAAYAGVPEEAPLL